MVFDIKKRKKNKKNRKMDLMVKVSRTYYVKNAGKSNILVADMKL